MNQENLYRLFIKYINNECSGEEVELLLRHFETSAHDRDLRQFISEQLETRSTLNDDKKQLLENAFFNIQQTIHKPAKKFSLIHLNRRLTAVAAILIFAIAAAVVLFIGNKKETAFFNTKQNRSN